MRLKGGIRTVDLLLTTLSKPPRPITSSSAKFFYYLFYTKFTDISKYILPLVSDFRRREICKYFNACLFILNFFETLKPASQKIVTFLWIYYTKYEFLLFLKNLCTYFHALMKLFFVFLEFLINRGFVAVLRDSSIITIYLFILTRRIHYDKK